LREIGRNFGGYHGLMAHCRELLSGRIVDVAYEALVDDPEGVIQGVLRRCGLSFDPACLAFFNSSEADSSASAVQVRHPIYRSSVESWRSHAPNLGHLLEELVRPPAVSE
jgi:hypothetical protein